MTECPPFMILNMILLVLLFLLSLLAPLVHTLFFSRNNTESIQEMLLKYSLFFNIGCLFIIGFAGHFLYPKEIAQCLSWNWSPFQYELSFSELALAILGMSCSIFNYQFWLATIIASSIWLLGASGVHIYYDLISGTVISNGAFVVYWNIFIVFWIIGLYFFYHKSMPKTFKQLILQN